LEDEDQERKENKPERQVQKSEWMKIKKRYEIEKRWKQETIK
jgi:hypothetical protein